MEQAESGQQTKRKTAYDYRHRLQSITGWSDDDLKRLPIYDGDVFQTGEVYFNLNLPERGPFRPDQRDRPLKGYLYVAKGEVPDYLWLRLIDGWGTDLPMGNQAPQPGAFGQDTHITETGYGSTGAENAGQEPRTG